MHAPGGVPTAHCDTFARSLLPPEELWPRFDFSAPRISRYPDRINVATALLDAAVAAGGGNRPMLFFGDIVWTYRHMLDRVERLARVLVEDLGLKTGGRVLLRSPNNPMMAACWLAVVRAGGIAVTTTPLLRAHELGQILDKAQIGISLCERSLTDELEAAGARRPAPLRIASFTALGDGDAELDRRLAAKPTGGGWADTAADDIALICFTSGTTGRPKAAVHFHRAILAACDCWLGTSPAESSDVFLGTSSMAFTFGLTSNLLYPLRAGAAAVIASSSRPEDVWAAIRRRRVTHLNTAPTAYLRLLEAGADREAASSLRWCLSSGEHLRPEIWRRWLEATGTRIMEGFGSTELLTRVLSQDRRVEHVGATGRPVEGYTLALMDEHGSLLPDGAGRGRLAVRGPTGGLYLGDPDLQRAFVVDGWNVLSDVFERDSEGWYWYVDRFDGIIVSSGYNIAAAEVERVIVAHPKVLECAVVGVPDPERGKIVRACIVLRDPDQASESTALEIQEHVKSTIAPYKYPRDVRFLRDLPKTASGKVQRFRLVSP